MGTGTAYNSNQKQPPNHLTKKIIIFALYALIPLALLHYYLFSFSPSNSTTTTTIAPIQRTHTTTSTPPIQRTHTTISTTTTSTSSFSRPSSQGSQAASEKPRSESSRRRKPCDYSEGQWVHDKSGPVYNGTSCGAIKDRENCMAHGRPDTGYLYWRWRPNECGLPPFDAAAFFDLIKNKHLAFVGDSMARNQMESLICLLSSASEPELKYIDGEEHKFQRWAFKEHKATVSLFWSPFLVNGTQKSTALGLDHNKLHLDMVDERWANELDGIDMVVLSIGHWFLHPAMFYEGDKVLGCHHCPGEVKNKTEMEIGFFGAFRKVIRNTLAVIAERQGMSQKLVVVATFSPAHFEGEWDKAGACPKAAPYKLGEKEMEYMDKEMHKVQLEEVSAAARGNGAKKIRIKALDVTKLAFLRPDAHPGPYMNTDPFAGKDGGKEEHQRVQNDCVHWCLPGAIDAWNEILLQIIARWRDSMR